MAPGNRSGHRTHPEASGSVPLSITVAWLTRELRESSELRLLDVSNSARHRENPGYLPRAVRIDFDALFNNGPTAAPDPLLFAATLSQAGVGDDDIIVAYDDGEDTRARQFHYWLRRYGHARAYYLVGGRSEWVLRGQQVVAQPERRTASSFTVKIGSGRGLPTSKDDLLRYRSKKRTEKKRAA